MIDWLYHIFIDPIADGPAQKALIGGCMIAVVSGAIGSIIVLRRMVFLTDALSHSMLAGVVCSYLFLRIVMGSDGADGPALLLGAILAGLVTVAMVSFVSRVSRIKEDAAIGMMYTAIFALGAVLASIYRHLIHIDLYHFVVGQVLGVSDGDLWAMAVITAVTLSIVILFFRHLQLVAFDRIMAASIGIPVLLLDYTLTACTSLVVVGAVNMVGVIQIVGLMVTPAATAYILCDRLSRMMVLAAIFGVSSVVGGIYLMSWTGNFPPGASIVIVSTAQFMIVLAVAPRYGLIADSLRRWRLVPETTVEDVLGSIRRGKGEPVALQTIQKYVEAPAKQIQRAIKTLLRRDWVDESDNAYVLTEVGRREARRLLRAHRLWEAYLEHLGVSEQDLHPQAHTLEHLHDEETIDYIDDKLGHPLRDPHGAEIPEDFVHLIPGHEVKAALLRRGHRATVTEVHAAAQETGLTAGTEVTTRPRQDAGETWVLLTSDGREVRLTHEAADAVTVRLLGPAEPNPSR